MSYDDKCRYNCVKCTYQFDAPNVKHATTKLHLHYKTIHGIDKDVTEEVMETLRTFFVERLASRLGTKKRTV